MSLFFKVIQKGRADIIERWHGKNPGRLDGRSDIALRARTVHKRNGVAPSHHPIPSIVRTTSGTSGAFRAAPMPDWSGFENVVVLDFFGLGHIEIESVCGADFIFNLDRDAVIFLEEGLGVFTALPDPLVTVTEPRA